jgi:hypothetical protein
MSMLMNLLTTVLNKTGKIIHVYKIAAWNANGLTQHLKEVEVFLITQKIDILLVSETHFTE